MALDREFAYFKAHQEDLVRKFNGRFVVIVGEKVVADYATESEAYTETVKNHLPGTFLIQHCISGENAYSQTYHSRVIFA
jgi:hypothetical protein